MSAVGERVPRIEDEALLRGAGRYVDDLQVPGMLHAAFVRSTAPHARLVRIDASAAMGMPGVVACLGHAELAATLGTMRLPIAFPREQLGPEAMPWVLARDEVVHVGEPVAIVVATSRGCAEDAALRVTVALEPLPPVADCRDALREDTPPACIADPIRLFKRFRVAWGDCDAAFRDAHAVVQVELQQERGLAQPIEGRGILANPDPATGALTVFASTQMPHELAHTICRMLAVPEHLVRVVTPDVGGAFGAKYLVYPEDVAVTAAAWRLRRPVKWIEDRHEHFVSAIQEREQRWSVEAAVDADGRLRGVRGRMVHDQGAYAPHSVNVPYNAATSMPGPYVLPAYDLDVAVARTNKVPVIPIRGAGYPQGCFAMERLMDGIADRLGIDRGEVRLRNYVPAASMPYETPMRNRAGGRIVYDSGDYPGSHRRVLQAIDIDAFRDRQRALRASGRYIGLGLAHAVKGTGRGPFESATVRVGCDGRVSVFTGAAAMGQGLATALAQICADGLSVPVERIDVVCGDTHSVSLGMGGFASRQTVTAGSSVHLAAAAVRKKALHAAAVLSGRPAESLRLCDGEVRDCDDRSPPVPLGELALRLRGLPGYAFPEGVDPGLEATVNHRIDPLAYANSCHACEVEVDVETGLVRVNRYVALQDSGRLVNPMLVEGQVHGGVVHGIGTTLYEEMRYDDQARPLTTRLADYLMPTAAEVPTIEVILPQTPSPLNPLGVKGAGEGGVIPVAAAIVSAIEDALSPFGVRIDRAPVSPAWLLERILAAGPAHARASGDD